MLMQNPKVKLAISPKADVENCLCFIKRRYVKNPEFVKWFLPKEFYFLLSKKFSQKERDKILRRYTEHIFELKKQEIKDGIIKVKKDWQLASKRYFYLVNKIFKNHPWPRGRYIGYASIYHMFPRNIREKTFFFPYVHKISKFAHYVIAHEMLHFAFFDYISKVYNLKENSKFLNKPSNYIWQISEVFNSVIENWDPYRKIFKIKGLKRKPYTGQKYFKKMLKQWTKKQDIDCLLDQWMKR